MSEKIELPKGWELKKLGEVCDIIMGQSPPSNTYNFGGDGLPFFQGKAEFTELHPVVGKWCNAPNKIALPNDILLSVRAPVGTTNIANQKCCIGRGLAAIRYENYKYIYYFLKSIEQLLDKRGTGTTFRSISGEIIRTTEIPLPPLAQQIAIVAKIEELLSDLENGKQQLLTAQAQLKVYRQSLLKWAFEGKLTTDWRNEQSTLPSSKILIKNLKEEKEDICKINKIKIKPILPISDEEISELPELPSKMVWVRLGEILWSVKDGPHYSPKYQTEGIPFISGGNIRPNGIDFKNTKFISKELHEELSRRCKPEKLDILYTKGGTTGIAKVNNYDIDFNVWVHVAVLKAIPSINPYYLQHVLNSNHCYKQSQKYTHGVGNQDLGLTRMILITLPICSLSEQTRIVEELESKLTICDKIEETISQSLLQAETLRQSILKKAFEGRLV